MLITRKHWRSALLGFCKGNHHRSPVDSNHMMTSSNGNIFRVSSGLLCGEFTSHRWISRTKATDAELWCYFHMHLNRQLSKQCKRWWFEMLPHSLPRHCNEWPVKRKTIPYQGVSWRHIITSASTGGQIDGQDTWAPSQYPKIRLSVRSRKVSKPRDWYFKLSYRFEIWQAHRQHCCRSACQISERSDNSKYKSRGFETLRDLTERRLSGYWDGALVS